MSDADAHFYAYANVGVHLIPSRDAEAYGYENVGVHLVPSKSATAYGYENVGLERAPEVRHDRATLGWGVRVIPNRVITLIPADSITVAYGYLGDVTEEAPPAP